MPVSADELCRGGMSYPAAIEVARQMNAGVSNGNVGRLMAVGIPGEQAKELAKQINAGAFDAHKLALTNVNPALAALLKRTSGI
ncbi:hypothetical protein EOA60_18190 [Mesorhizobium sp. M1A.F.Ca.IN.020.06.1.1]|uniref:hypothetical protein n=1 Tax=unclassified Mesorhizobium TaxID=325217 RepID=UPI000FCA4622|nr:MULTISPECIES: hypothetical protein [unclassified Mesorhizobium]RUV90251.1 hypothetical protein EOA51_00600 [Mesorhizobium sp. M1A.F.Ca.IN.020.32.1.1]RUW12726.1 hypothetical protein EOA46_08435 [Mesorhizobium sp. M1A.F.Ca.IN.022.05.2.1]RUW27323.1 hypothetical protein EOA60_18190 [Mesorhizobium sp. M1A.F.Ca.IN.020.06.1.1]RWF81259.1 MAG: hypothetical protein EOQ35_14435 [Mesorhizobium sp.]RWG04193.1 MAG: hypothetical protein EOQ38_06540 [Mesorhizobium sp.]